jgi:hypothetical protein
MLCKTIIQQKGGPESVQYPDFYNAGHKTILYLIANLTL